jgi:hypothetical protein
VAGGLRVGASCRPEARRVPPAETAVTDAGGDRGQALLVTTWNSFMAGGGAVGGILLDLLGPASFPWSVLALLAPVLAVVVGARARGFPVKRPGME